MARLGICWLLPAALLGCSGPDTESPTSSQPEAVSSEIEESYQNREALIYGLDQLEREAEARARLGLPVPGESQSEGD